MGETQAYLAEEWEAHPKSSKGWDKCLVLTPSCNESNTNLHKCGTHFREDPSYEQMQEVPKSLGTLLCNAMCNFFVLTKRSYISNFGFDLSLSPFS